MMITADFMILGATAESLRLAKRIAQAGRGCLILESRQREELEPVLATQSAPIVYGLRLSYLAPVTDAKDTLLTDQQGRGYLTPTLLSATAKGVSEQLAALAFELPTNAEEFQALLSRRSLDDGAMELPLRQKMRQCAATHPNSYRTVASLIEWPRFHRVA